MLSAKPRPCSRFVRRSGSEDHVKRNAPTILALLWLVLIPLFWQLDVSHPPSGNYGVYDTFDMAPFSILHMLVFYALMSLSLYVRKNSLVNILFIALYHPLIVLSNYPYLIWRDVYLHSAPVRSILADGNLQGYSRDPLPAYWPSSFVLHGLSATVLDCDIIATTYVLYLSLVVALALVIYCLARRFEITGYTLAWVCPILFLALYQNHTVLFHSFSRAHLSTVLALFFLFALVQFEGRRGAIAQLLFCVTLVTTHPFQSFYTSMILFAPFLLNILNRNRTGAFKRFHIALFSAVSVLAWWLFHAQLDPRELVYFLGNFWNREYVERLANAAYVQEQVPIWASISRSLYKYSLLALLLVAPSVYIIRFIKREKLSEESSTIVVLLSVTAASGLFSLVLMALPAWGLYRASTHFLAVPAAFSSIIYFNHVLRKKRAALNKMAVRFVVVIFVVALSLSTMLIRFENNQYYSELEHPSELSSLMFLFSHIQSSSTDTRAYAIAGSFQTSVWAEYFAYNSSHEFLRYIDPSDPHIFESRTRLFFSQAQAIDQSDFAIRGVRDMVVVRGDLKTSSELGDRLHEETVSTEFNQIYCNWHFSITMRVTIHARLGVSSHLADILHFSGEERA